MPDIEQAEGSASGDRGPIALAERATRTVGIAPSRWTLVSEFESDGERYILARERAVSCGRIESLSKRERQVVSLAVIGRANKMIAYELGLAHSTVRVLMRRAAEKLGVKSRKELVSLSVSEQPRAAESACAE